MAPTYTYNYGANPPIDWPRMLIADTDTSQPMVFADEEILAATAIQQTVMQSGQYYTFTIGTANPAPLVLPHPPTSYFRIAAMLLRCMASNKAKLASIKQLLDVKLDSSDSARWLGDQADKFLEMDDNSGAFVIAEMVQDYASFRERFWKQVQRMTAPA